MHGIDPVASKCIDCLCVACVQSLRRAPSEAAESGGSRCQHEEGTRQAVRPYVYALVGVPEGACSEALHHPGKARRQASEAQVYGSQDGQGRRVIARTYCGATACGGGCRPLTLGI